MSALIQDIRTIQNAVGVLPDGVFGPRTAAEVMNHLAKLGIIYPDAVKEQPEGLDPRTLATIATLDPKARERFYQFARLAKATAASMGCDYIAICGHRTWEEQDVLYKQKPKVTNAKGGYSNHNFGIAVDFGVFQANGKTYCDDVKPDLARRVHCACAAHAAECGLDWGGKWTSIVDQPHYEIHTGLTMAQKRELYQQKGSVL